MTGKDFERSAQVWEGLGRTDPLWAVLSDPSKRGGGWYREEFFSFGEVEIAAVVAHADSLVPHLARTSALDFGCGVGRLTQALARRFTTVVGVDISATMLELAREYDEKENCQFQLNERDDLSIFDSDTFDLVYSSITLQHIPLVAAQRYIAEFVRVVRPGGLIVFQIPSRRVGLAAQLKERVPSFIRSLRWSGIEVHGVRRPNVEETLRTAGASILKIEPDASVGPSWESFRYSATKA